MLQIQTKPHSQLAKDSIGVKSTAAWATHARTHTHAHTLTHTLTHTHARAHARAHARTHSRTHTHLEEIWRWHSVDDEAESARLPPLCCCTLITTVPITAIITSAIIMVIMLAAFCSLALSRARARCCAANARRLDGCHAQHGLQLVALARTTCPKTNKKNKASTHTQTHTNTDKKKQTCTQTQYAKKQSKSPIVMSIRAHSVFASTTESLQKRTQGANAQLTCSCS